MTSPRYIVPGTTYLITRRCTQRQFLLTPSPRVKEILSYALAYAAARNGVQLHAFCFLSNHYHVVLTDPGRNVCDFLQQFHSMVARALNEHYGRSEALWASCPTSVVRLIEHGDVIDKLLYTVCNPVSSGLVPRSSIWPGLRSRVQDYGVARTFERPGLFFREDGPTPQRVELCLCPPPGSDEGFAEELEDWIEERESELRERARAQRKRFLGLEAIRAQHPEDRPKTVERKYERSPHIACKNRERRLEEIEKWECFKLAYREALKRLRPGVTAAGFPRGTYKLVKQYGEGAEGDGPAGAEAAEA